MHIYRVITHGKLKYSAVNHPDKNASFDIEIQDEKVQKAINSDFAELGPLGLGEFADDVSDCKIVIPAPEIDITHVDKFVLKWTITTDKKLTEEEKHKLLRYVQGQCSDGWGEGFEQNPIKGIDVKVTVDCDCDFGEECHECDGKQYVEDYCELYVSPWDKGQEKQDSITEIQNPVTSSTKIKEDDIADVVTVCPYCMNEVGNKTSCCGESCAHFEEAYLLNGGQLVLESDADVEQAAD